MAIPTQMLEAIVDPELNVKVSKTSVPEINADQVLIKVVVSGTNPKDWKYPKLTSTSINSGDDIAGLIAKVGQNVTEFKVGDRVAAFHEIMAPHGSFAEYAVAWSHTTFHLPLHVSFEEGATIPLAAMTAAFGLYDKLLLPGPFTPTLKPLPLIVWGASSGVGAFGVKLARASNIHPIIAIAGKSQSFVESLLDSSKGDVYVDYRAGEDAVIAKVNEAVKAAGAQEVNYALDAISEYGSYETIAKILGSSGQITTVLPPNDSMNKALGKSTTSQLKGDFKFPSNVKHTKIMVHASHWDIKEDSEAAKAGIVTNGKDFAFVYFRLFARGLQQGWFKAHPYEIVPGGLDGIETGLKKLQSNEVSATKLVYQISKADEPKL